MKRRNRNLFGIFLPSPHHAFVFNDDTTKGGSGDDTVAGGGGGDNKTGDADIEARIAAAVKAEREKFEAAAAKQRQKEQEEREAEEARKRGEFEQLAEKERKAREKAEAERDAERLALKAERVQNRIVGYLAEHHKDYPASVAKYVKPLVSFDKDTDDAEIDKRIKDAAEQYVKDNPRKTEGGGATANSGRTNAAPVQHKSDVPKLLSGAAAFM